MLPKRSDANGQSVTAARPKGTVTCDLIFTLTVAPRCTCPTRSRGRSSAARLNIKKVIRCALWLDLPRLDSGVADMKDE